MKIQHLITAALFAAPVCQAAQEVVLTDEIATSMEAAMMRQVLSDYARCLKSLCGLIESVHDRASAEAALPKIQARMQILKELQFGVDYTAQDEIEQALTAAGVTPERLETTHNQLVQNKFYGCAELAQVFGYPASAMMEPGEVTPDLLQTLGTELKAALGNKVDSISGGPGFTEQTAWNLDNNPDHLELIPTIMEALPGAEKEDQTLVRTEEGPIYGRMTYILPYQGKAYRLQMWFDITEIIKAEEAAAAQEEEAEEEYTEAEQPVVEETPVTEENPQDVTMVLPQEVQQQEQKITIYSEEEIADIVKQYVQLLKETAELTSQITDRATADAAAAQVKHLFEKSAAIPTDFSQISAMDVLEGLEKNNVNPSTIKENMERIGEADFYGSEALENAIKNR